MHTEATAFASQANSLDCEARRAWGDERCAEENPKQVPI